MTHASRARPGSIARVVLLACSGWLLVGAFGGEALAQPLTGDWVVTISESSNTCGDPLGPPDTTVVAFTESGGLVAVALPGGTPDQTPVEGTRSGSSLELGFEVFETDAAVLYDPADSSLAIGAGSTTIAGSLDWEMYSPEDCSGTQTWTGTRAGAGTPGDLSGADWTITVVEVSETCGPIDPTPVMVPVTIVQSGDLVEIQAPDFGQTRIRGTVTGSVFNLGLAIRETEGDLTVFDEADNPLTVDPGFASWTGTMTWTSWEMLDCTGVDLLTAPEPGRAGGLFAGIAALVLLRSRAASRSRSARARTA